MLAHLGYVQPAAVWRSMLPFATFGLIQFEDPSHRTSFPSLSVHLCGSKVNGVIRIIIRTSRPPIDGMWGFAGAVEAQL